MTNLNWRLLTGVYKLSLNYTNPRCLSTTSRNSSQYLRFDGQTAIITGAGRGLGREYALLLASRGANVVVNDFGGDRSGKSEAESGTRQAAEEVVEEIQEKYPQSQTLANLESVSTESGARSLVESTLNKFGRIDILINNAGILRDKSFGKMTFEDWDQVQAVHLRGSFLMSRACWKHMRSQEYGKIIMTSSTSGLYGNFGQANYSAAKMGLVGLSNTLAIEGASSNIHCNTVVPMAASRMTHDILPEDLANKLRPGYVAPIVAWLCHKDCQESGALVEAAGQWYGRYKLLRSRGKFLPGICDPDAEGNQRSVETVAKNWDSISSFDEGATRLDSFHDHLNQLLQEFERDSRESS